MKRSIFFGFILVFFFSLSLSLAHAAVTCPTNFQPSSAGVCIPTNTGLSQSSVSDVLGAVMKWLLGIFGFLAVIAFVISGIQYLMAAGDEDQAKAAKRNVQYSIVGIIVALSGFVILTAINAALTGSTTF